MNHNITMRKKMLTLCITTLLTVALALCVNAMAKKKRRAHAQFPQIEISEVPMGDVQIHYHTRAPLEIDSAVLAQDRTVEVLCGQTIDFIGQQHASVGLSFDLECDTAFFKVTEFVRYDHPESMDGLSTGGDRATKTIKLLTSQPGTSTVRIVEGWQGSMSNVLDYTIHVK